MNRAQLEEALLPPVVALLIAVLVGDLLILSFGQSPAAVFRLLLEGTWGNAYGFGQVLYKATTLTFTGLSVALALRAGLFNIGAESQLAAGGFAAALIGLVLPAGLPALLVLPLYLLAAAVAGGVVGGIPGALKAKFGAHEVITTIMLNFIVLALLNYLISGTNLKVHDTLHTAEIRSGALKRLADLAPAFHGSAANLVLLIGLLVVAASWWFLFRTRAGFELRAVGLQPHAAEYAGVHVGRVWWTSMALAGMVAGIGGLNYVLGYKRYYEEGFSAGAGFLGIAVALVGRNHPVGIVIAAILFATLSQGGLAVNALVPKQMVDVLQAVVIISMATAVPEVRRALLAIRPAASAKATA